MFGELVCNALSVALRICGIDNVAIGLSLFRKAKGKSRSFRGGFLHFIANELVRGDAHVCRKSVKGHPLGFFHGVLFGLKSEKGVEVFDYIIDRSCEGSEELDQVAEYLRDLLLRLPIFVLDFSLYEIHTETERKLMMPQLMSAIAYVRRVLTEINIVLANVPIEVMNSIRALASFRGTILNELESEEFYDRHVKEALLLDPYAPTNLSERECRDYRVFVLGMIIDDKVARPYATAAMARMLRLSIPRRRIVLWGSRIGVPNRVNKVMDIILSVREGMSLDDAVIKNMSLYDKVHRLRYEIERRKLATVENSQVLEELSQKLGIDLQKVRKVLGY